MSQISVSHLTFSYDGSHDDIFTNVSFQIDTDWKLGLCGRNGRGKTTLLKLLTGKYEYGGVIQANVDFEYFPYHVEDRENSVLDILQSIAPNALLWQIQKELSKLSVGEDVLYRPYSTLSNGEQTKSLLAGLFLREHSFLLIDEPTNHLDMDSRQAVSGYLSGKKGFILVSHDRAFLDECTDHTLAINKTDIEVINGSFSVWLEQKSLRDEFEITKNERLEREIGRLRESAARTSDWASRVEKSKKQPLKSGLSADKGYIGHKSAKMAKRAKSAEKRQQNAADEKSKLLKNIETAESLLIKPLEYQANTLLSFKDASVLYDGKQIFDKISFSLERGDRLAIRGGNGSGKSSILKLITGYEIACTGDVNIGRGLIISYVPQDASFLTGDLSGYAKEHRIDMTLFKTILRKLDFSRLQFEKNMGDYSAGQKKKVLIARSLCESAHVYVWDEPLNYIDVMSRIQIEELILKCKPTLLFVEHDKAFCDNIATKTADIK